MNKELREALQGAIPVMQRYLQVACEDNIPEIRNALKQVREALAASEAPPQITITGAAQMLDDKHSLNGIYEAPPAPEFTVSQSGPEQGAMPPDTPAKPTCPTCGSSDRKKRPMWEDGDKLISARCGDAFHNAGEEAIVGKRRNLHE